MIVFGAVERGGGYYLSRDLFRLDASTIWRFGVADRGHHGTDPSGETISAFCAWCTAFHNCLLSDGLFKGVRIAVDAKTLRHPDRWWAILLAAACAGGAGRTLLVLRPGTRGKSADISWVRRCFWTA